MRHTTFSRKATRDTYGGYSYGAESKTHGFRHLDSSEVY